MVTPGPVATGTDPALLLTADQLTAVAHSVGAPGFPGVTDSVYDKVDPHLHLELDGRFLATLAARGLLVPDIEEHLRPAGPLSAIVDAAILNQTYVTVWAGLERCALVAGHRGLLTHRIAEPLHQLHLDPDPVDLGTRLAGAIGTLVAMSPGDGQLGRRRHRGQWSRLPELVPAPDGGWRRITVLTRADEAGPGVRMAGFLAVLDGGAGELWLVSEVDGEPGGDDREVVAEPASDADVTAALRQFAAIPASGSGQVPRTGEVDWFGDQRRASWPTTN